MTPHNRELLPAAGKLHFAAEYPISAHDIVSPITDFEFLIGLMALKSPKYKSLFVSDRKPNKYRVVDSGVFEDPENPPDNEKLICIAEELDADEVVALDRIADSRRTLEAVAEFLKLAEGHSFKIQAVPQGRNLTEWSECYFKFVEDPRIDIIGISYFRFPLDLAKRGMENFQIPNLQEAARVATIHAVAAKHQTKPIHILGLGDLRAIRYYRELPFVRSIDTSFAVQLGVEGRSLRLDSEKSAFKVNFNADLVRGEKALISSNLMRFSQLCHRHDDPEVIWSVADNIAGVPVQGV